MRQGEPYLRIITEGKAPSSYTVMVKFPLRSTIESMDVGTPYHWNKVYPMDYGTNKDFNATMWATHDFVVPNASQVPLAAIYHSATSAWTSNDNTLYGVVLRNTPGGHGCRGYGADGSDDEIHVQTYALRIPSGIPNPQSGKLLKEARQYNTPMQAIPVPSNGTGNLPLTYSIATATKGSLVTSAKWSYTDPNDLILRLYQASNKPVSEIVTVSEKPSSCDIVTALEKPFKNSNNIPSCSTTSNTVMVKMPNAIATVKLEY
ncbi:hypothetical protein [Aquimarina algiphila]|uniref:hypothetical protein n=1 Tax=Aquimarina algiphila TaxID=2047982 RepID=UPI002330EC7F|nr:hypothetical protein [Aquimarina algiphila]